MLVDVPTRIVTAMIMINFGRPDIAKNSLEAIRDEISAVRREGHVEVLADCVLNSTPPWRRSRSIATRRPTGPSRRP